MPAPACRLQVQKDVDVGFTSREPKSRLSNGLWFECFHCYRTFLVLRRFTQHQQLYVHLTLCVCVCVCVEGGREGRGRGF
jgi:hypothetical protein